VRSADEIWHDDAGAPLDLWCLPPEGGRARILGLGALTIAGSRPQGDPGAGDPAGGAAPDDRLPEVRPGRSDAVRSDTVRSDTVRSEAERDAERDAAGDTPVRVMASDWWQAARSRGEWSLVSCAVDPGFTFEDFELLADRPLSQRPAGATLEWIGSKGAHQAMACPSCGSWAVKADRSLSGRMVCGRCGRSLGIGASRRRAWLGLGGWLGEGSRGGRKPSLAMLLAGLLAAGALLTALVERREPGQPSPGRMWPSPDRADPKGKNPGS
jgi:predicted cupin superfamily sugar epimerase/ribosomal protein S27AE